jgi:hypothetical protein
MEGRMRNRELGQALPLALLVLAAGVLIATPFLGHVSSAMIGSRTYGEAIIEKYSCDAGVEWALWRLKENPVLTTNTSYHTASLQPIPSEINGDSFPATEIRYVETEGGGGGTATITPEWQDGHGWHNYPLGQIEPGTVTVTIDNIIAYHFVMIRLDNPPGPPQFFWWVGPYVANFEIYSAGSCTVQVYLPNTRFYGPMGPGPITITITYPTAGGGGSGVTETIIPAWLVGADWVYYPFRSADTGTVLVVVECDAPIIRIKLVGAPGSSGGSPYTAPVAPVYPGQPDQQIQVQTRTYNHKGQEIPYWGPGTITITYPISSYDIRAQQGERTITARATASYMATRIISWQIE